MAKLDALNSVTDVGFDRDPLLDAWLLHFSTENNLEYALDPDKNASPEQMRFMVRLGDNLFYAPCSDWMLLHLINDWLDPELLDEYNAKWRALVHLVQDNVDDASVRKRVLALARHKYRMIRASPIIIPSRLMKRFITIFMTLSGISDPGTKRRAELNERAWHAVKSEAVQRYINACPERPLACRTLSDMRSTLGALELSRLLLLCTKNRLWETPGAVVDEASLHRELAEAEEQIRPFREFFANELNRGLKILYLPDTSGGLIFDLLLVRSLLSQGHSVVLALKDGFHFDSPVFWDHESDPVLAGQLRDARFVSEQGLSKNELLRIQRENRFLVISDGTREEMNLYRTSVTFARTWKEADLILAKGEVHRRRLIKSSHEFTRDLFCFWRDDNGRFACRFKEKPAGVTKFSESGLSAMAESIISAMRAAKAEGKSVMFYSAIIGSIPGQTKTALEILNTFVDYLRRRLDYTHIINPGEYFVEGMDADDLMYMWEMVQRSGLIDVWRFQTVEDIEKSFELMGRKVPPFWTGKDSTFSTGCTKEMQIALSMQERNREMQIIGPSPDKFFRRREYGVGKFCDAAIDCS